MCDKRNPIQLTTDKHVCKQKSKINLQRYKIKLIKYRIHET